jgi:hypothetical protein
MQRGRSGATSSGYGSDLLRTTRRSALSRRARRPSRGGLRTRSCTSSVQAIAFPLEAHAPSARQQRAGRRPAFRVLSRRCTRKGSAQRPNLDCACERGCRGPSPGCRARMSLELLPREPRVGACTPVYESLAFASLEAGQWRRADGLAIQPDAKRDSFHSLTLGCAPLRRSPDSRTDSLARARTNSTPRSS